EVVGGAVVVLGDELALPVKTQPGVELPVDGRADPQNLAGFESAAEGVHIVADERQARFHLKADLGRRGRVVVGLNAVRRKFAPGSGRCFLYRWRQLDDDRCRVLAAVLGRAGMRRPEQGSDSQNKAQGKQGSPAHDVSSLFSSSGPVRRPGAVVCGTV